MGLIKTGLALAGGYGLIKAASKAVNDHEDKKQRRSNQSQYQCQQQYYSGNEPQIGYTQGNQMNYHASQPQWSSSSEAQYYHGNHTSNNHSQLQSRGIRENSRCDKRISQSPPRYYQGLATERQDGVQPGSAQEYFSGRKL